MWITGGGTGIGKALALKFVEEGAKVALSGRREARLSEVVDSIGADRALSVPLDVTIEEDVFEAADKVASHFGSLDVAIANAGFGVNGKMSKVSATEWRRQLDVNVVGAASTYRAALPWLKKADVPGGHGRMVLVGSVMAMLSVPGSGAYAASKYAVRAMGETIRMELRGSGVSCTTLHPGFVESEIGQVDNSGVFHEDKSDPRPQRFMWTAEDAARVCVGAIYRRRGEFVFTNHGKFASFMGKHFPGMTHAIIGRNF